MTKMLLIAVALATITSYSASAHTEEYQLLSPRARENQARVISGTGVTDPDLLIQRPSGNAKAWEHAQSVKRVPITVDNVDLAHAARPAMSAKDPRFDMALQNNAVKTFQVAPLK